MSLFLATGTGHCGTGWFARFMSRLGYPCTHEGSFNPWRHGPLKSSDSSLFAVPWLTDDVPVVCLVRDPLDVLNSFMANKAFSIDPGESRDYPYSKFYYEYCPETRNYRHSMMRLMAFITSWDWDVKGFTFRVGLDTGRGDELAELVRYCTGDVYDPHELTALSDEIGRVNRPVGERPNLTWNHLPDGRLKDRMLERKYRLGV